ncbi:MAG: hypothetical protein LUD16_12825 [Lachnospiraceae bacterium]|nr:hypothetical protein [Lachnospiraceae bacterium]
MKAKAEIKVEVVFTDGYQERFTMENEQEQRKILKWLLKQTFRAEQRKQRLDQRLLLLSEKRNSPIGGAGYDPLPAHTGNSDGAAGIIFKISEIEERIYAQKAEIEKCILQVMDIIDHLPADSIEREICEMRHIDMMSWQEIQSAIPMSRSQCNRRYNAALDILVQNEHIVRLIEENKDRYYEWELARGIQEARRNASKKQSGGSDPENKSGKFSREKSRKARKR